MGEDDIISKNCRIKDGEKKYVFAQSYIVVFQFQTVSEWVKDRQVHRVASLL